MKFVSVYKHDIWGGLCTQCGRDVPAHKRVQILAEYTDEKDRAIVEPFNVCKTCLKELRSE